MQHYAVPPHTYYRIRPYSYARRNQDFLTRLGNARLVRRLQMVLHSTPEQLTAIREVADCVRQEKILVSESDGTVFRRKDIVLRIIASATETDNRKRRQLIINHRLLASLLKREYICRTCGYVERTQMNANYQISRSN